MPILARQTGQALPVGLALIMMGALATLVLFNTGKMAGEKANVTNAADAAVYSGLVWQARSLNFQAYTNRAMVANQVSIAQLVSLGSWTNYGRISARNLDYALGWIPVVKPFTAAALQVMTQIENIVQSGVKVAIPIINGINDVLSIAQEAVYNASYVVTPEVVSAVVKANDLRFSSASTYALAAQVRNAVEWEGLTQRVGGNAPEMQRKLEVIDASRGEWSRARGWNRLGNLPRKVYLTPLDRFSIVKEGNTELVHAGNSWEWRGKDSLSIHWEHFSCSLGDCGWEHHELPIGWGQNFAYSESECPGGNCSGWFAENRFGEQLADAEAVSLGDAYSGVKSYRTLRNLSAENRDPRLTLHVEVELATGDIRTAEKIALLGSPEPPDGQLMRGMESGLFHTQDEYTSDALASISSGEVFFERPVLDAGDELVVAGHGSVTEYGNLFNPYWEVRLIEVTEAERQLAWVTRDAQLSSGAVATYARRAASDTLLAQQPILRAAHDAARYAALGERALATLSSGVIENAVKEQALNALQNIAQGAISSYASGALSDYVGDSAGAFGDFAEDALADGELSTDDLLDGAEGLLGDRFEGTELGDAVALGQGLLGDGGNAADILLAQAGISDTAEYLNEQIKALGSDLGDDLIASLEENFAAEIELRDQLESLGNSVNDLGGALDQQINELSAQLLSGAQGEINAQIDLLEQELRANYGGEFNLDRDEILESFSGNFDDVATHLVGETSEVVSETIDGLKNAIGEQFAGLEFNPDTVRGGIFNDANDIIGEQSAAVDEQLDSALENAGELLTEVTEEQLDSAIDEVTERFENTLDDYRGTLDDQVASLPDYVN